MSVMAVTPWSPCAYCDHNEYPCGEFAPTGGVCTRPRGHDGEHVACSTDEHPLVAWSDEERSDG